MTVPDDLTDLLDPRVAALVPQWLDLVAERLCVPGVSIRRAGSALIMLLPDRLLLTLSHTGSRWAVRAQSLVPLPHLGREGRQFSVLGTIDLDLEAGCPGISDTADAVRRLLDVDVALSQVRPDGDDRLLRTWLRMRATTQP